ncbi:MAG TPA: sigma factor-like helix-turn-helix DNA-binding protein [Polyangia bacterium]|nr:sigma factor-like helix-turn-helix DNA-binding protein [Polyangia bacterium]
MESGPEDGALESALAQAVSRGRTAFPRLAVEDATFVDHLARALAPGPVTADAVAALAVEDLYLACACLVGVEGALAVFRERHGATIRGTVARVVPASDVSEVEQRLLQSLLVGSPESPPKIGSYAGKAPIDRWLGVSAQRAALVWLRESKAESQARGAAAAEPALGGHTHPENLYMKERYRGDFEQALEVALGRLPERDRVLLRLQLINGVTVEKIGTMYSVSQATASRWLAAAREKLLDDVKQALQARLGTSSSELASLAGMVASRIDLSLSMLLKTG